MEGKEMKSPIKAGDSVMAMQVCFVTDDIQSTVNWFAKLLDQPTPSIVQAPPADVAKTRYRGRRADVTFRQALMKWRGTQLEFIEPGPEASIWRDWLEEHGPGIHHVGFAVKDFDATRASLVDLGLPIMQEGEFPKGRYAYAHAKPPVGAVVEILDVDEDDVRTHGMD